MGSDRNQTDAGPKKKTRCILSADRQTFTIRMRTWSETLPIGQLDDQIDFYTKLSTRKGGQYAENFNPTVRALQRLKDRIEGDQP